MAYRIAFRSAGSVMVTRSVARERPSPHLQHAHAAAPHQQAPAALHLCTSVQSQRFLALLCWCCGGNNMRAGPGAGVCTSAS